jgi:RTA1 like protein
MTLGRLIRALRAEQYSVIRVTWLTKIFVIGDVLSFFIQGGGGGVMASNSKDTKLGENIILGGLFFQLITFGLFVVAAVILHMRMRKRGVSDPSIKWEQMLMVLYTVSGLIIFRNILRVVEYIGGRQGPLLRIEWPIYVFDAVPMAVTMLVFFVWYPALLRPSTVDPEAHTELRSVTTVDMSSTKEDRYARRR